MQNLSENDQVFCYFSIKVTQSLLNAIPMATKREYSFM